MNWVAVRFISFHVSSYDSWVFYSGRHDYFFAVGIAISICKARKKKKKKKKKKTLHVKPASPSVGGSVYSKNVEGTVPGN